MNFQNFLCVLIQLAYIPRSHFANHSIDYGFLEAPLEQFRIESINDLNPCFHLDDRNNIVLEGCNYVRLCYTLSRNPSLNGSKDIEKN